jgi:uncharacterized protein
VALSDEKYLLFTSFRRTGTPVSTPVWVVDLGDGRMGFWTSSGSGKAKRLAHTARVTVQPCDGRGRVKPGTGPTEATATLVSGDEYDVIRERVIAKYGFMTKLATVAGTLITRLHGKRIPYGDRGVVISVSPTV